MKWVIFLALFNFVTSCCKEHPIIYCFYADGTIITEPTDLRFVRQSLTKLVSKERLDSSNLKVFTSLKPGIKKALDLELKTLQDTIYSLIQWENSGDKQRIDSLRKENKMIAVGLVAIDNKTGKVVAHYSNSSKEQDFVTTRQSIGTLNKTLLYLLAMEKEFSPFDRYPQMKYPPNGNRDELIPDSSIHRSFTSTFGNSFIENFPLGLTRRYSNADAFLLQRKLGLDLRNYKPLSANGFDTEASLLELARIWSAFYNKGISHDPIVIHRITDIHGKQLYHSKAMHERLFDEETANELFELLNYYAHFGQGMVVERKYKHIPDYIGNFGILYPRNGSGYFMAITNDYTIVVLSTLNGYQQKIGTTALHPTAKFTVPVWLKTVSNLRKNKPKSDFFMQRIHIHLEQKKGRSKSPFSPV